MFTIVSVQDFQGVGRGGVYNFMILWVTRLVVHNVIGITLYGHKCDWNIEFMKWAILFSLIEMEEFVFRAKVAKNASQYIPL
jgi:hypothetical protein